MDDDDDDNDNNFPFSTPPSALKGKNDALPNSVLLPCFLCVLFFWSWSCYELSHWSDKGLMGGVNWRHRRGLEAEQRTRLRRSPPYCLGTVYTPECMIGKRLSCRRTSISPSSFSNKLEKQKIKFFFCLLLKNAHTFTTKGFFSS